LIEEENSGKDQDRTALGAGDGGNGGKLAKLDKLVPEGDKKIVKTQGFRPTGATTVSLSLSLSLYIYIYIYGFLCFIINEYMHIYIYNNNIM